jgi:hypothetical protein
VTKEESHGEDNGDSSTANQQARLASLLRDGALLFKAQLSQQMAKRTADPKKPAPQDNKTEKKAADGTAGKP